MATAMLATDRGLRRKIVQEEPLAEVAPKSKKAPKRKTPTASARSAATLRAAEQNNNVKRQRFSAVDNKDDMLAAYQPWVIQTYGDLAKTKTITIKKYARILRTLRGEEIVSADNSKFRFWVKAKGFHVGKPPGYEAKAADAIVGRFSVCDADEGIPAVNDKLLGSAKDPPLYVPNAPFKNSSGEPVYRKVAIVENFFDIIYNVHVELEGRPGKHAGQKRTYRTITETYAFLPREAVTRFLLGCTECQKHPRSPSPASVLPTPSPSPTLPLVPASVLPLATPPPPSLPAAPAAPAAVAVQTPEMPPYLVPPSPSNPTPSSAETLDLSSSTHHRRNGEITQQETADGARPGTPEEPAKRSSNPLDVCNLTAKDPPRSPPKKRHLCENGTTTPHHHHNPTPKLWSPVESIEREQQESKRRRILMAGEIDYSLPITTTYLKYMRSLGCTDEDALKFENKHIHGFGVVMLRGVGACCSEMHRCILMRSTCAPQM